jgi:hypothetical protein
MGYDLHLLDIYTLIHVAISLVGIVSGLIVLFGMFGGKRLNGPTLLFLIATVLTSVTGFGFPFEHLSPPHIVGIISLVVLLLAILARYKFHLAGTWRAIYVITAVMALYFNFFVLVVQSFLKVPALHALAPTQKEPPFAIVQGVVLVLFLVLGVLAVKKFHPDSGMAARAA